MCYYYDPDVGNYYYGQGHPMKPHRIRMTHNLLEAYGIDKELEIVRPDPTPWEDMTAFHTDEYIQFMRFVTPDNQHEYPRQLRRFNLGEDCPAFDGLMDFCSVYTGGSVAGAHRLMRGDNDIAVNWAGGARASPPKGSEPSC